MTANRNFHCTPLSQDYKYSSTPQNPCKTPAKPLLCFVFMGDPRSPNAAALSYLLPGFLFYPSEEQLICYYLASKNSDIPCDGVDVIKEIDSFKFDPFNLPETTCFEFGIQSRRRHWYCYVGGVDVDRWRKAAVNGYWERRGRVKAVMSARAGAGEVAVGTRKTFVFYLSNGNKAAARTDWVMYEYALNDHPMASFVLCRVFVKSDARNNISDNESSSSGEQSAVTVSHIRVQHQHEGVVTVRHQHDGAVIAESKPREENAADNDDENHMSPCGQAYAAEDRNPGDPVDQQVKQCKDAAYGAMNFDGLSTQELVAILEGNFIELDDLVFPPQGTQL